jgi:pyruvate kinase
MSLAIRTKELKKIRGELRAIRGAMTALEMRFAHFVRGVHPHYRESARNLLHYLALRRRDLRPLQQSLSRLGLSSLGRGESGAMGSVETVLGTVERLLAHEGVAPAERRAPSSTVLKPEAGRALLAKHARALLGEPVRGRRVRIMVTMPGDAARDRELMRGLLERGMNVMRINCAHDDPDTWSGMIKNLRLAERATGKKCRIFMDLAGPKPRTGPVAAGPPVVCWRPVRDSLGSVVAKARVFLTSAMPDAVPDARAVLPVASDWLARRSVGDVVRFLDARKSARKLEIVQRVSGGVWAESDQTSYVTPGTVLYVQIEEDGYEESWLRDEAAVGAIPTGEGRIPLRKGDRLLLTRDRTPGEPAVIGEKGSVERPAHIGVTLPRLLAEVRPGDRIWFDDGKIGGVVRGAGVRGVEVEITHVRDRGRKLASGRSINLPDTRGAFPSLTPADAKNLGFVSRHADMVGLSFAHSPSDIRSVQRKLSAEGAGKIGLVVKIENRKAFERLPELLLTAMRSPAVGVLIGRGDLAVECGYERLAEIQEEILWLCEAAHLPVFWATQVLEILTREGMPSRAEVTDAAAGERAECVMLNKGPYIFSALDTLDSILRRMQTHATKKRPHLRPLRVAKRIGRKT